MSCVMIGVALPSVEYSQAFSIDQLVFYITEWLRPLVEPIWRSSNLSGADWMAVLYVC